MTKLEGVNEVLIAAGRDPVKALDTDGASPAAEAERRLDRANIDVQSLGWHFNRRKNVELEPNDDGNIEVPEGVITIDGDQENGESINITTVGNGLYNLDDNTDEFEDNVTVAYVLCYLFPCVPLLVQKLITATAAVEYNLTRYGTKERQPRLEYNKQMAWSYAARYDEDVADVDVLDTDEMRSLRGGRDRSYIDTSVNVRRVSS